MAHFDLINNNRLISEAEWHNKIEEIRESLKEVSLIKDKEASKKLIFSALHNAISLRAKKKFGILLSGGLDSTIITYICKVLNKDFQCFTVGMTKSSDLEYSREVSELLGVKLITRELSLSDVETSLMEVIRLLHSRDVVKLEIATVFYSSLGIASNHKYNAVFMGSGSEEIFAGYKRHENMLNSSGYKLVQSELWNGLKSCYGRDIVRDYLISQKFDIKLLLPFLDLNFIRDSMKIHPMLKINSDFKKLILREIAMDLGIPKHISFRKRTAAQYGARVSDCISKLCKKNGFKLKQDYINSLW